MRKHAWRIIATGAIILSIVSLWLPILTYTNADGVTEEFNLPDIMLDDSYRLEEFVFDNDYIGTDFEGVPLEDIRNYALVLGGIGIGAILLSFAGIHSMSKQRESSWPFRLTLLGLFGTSIPSLALLILFLLSEDQFKGDMQLGAYIVITPIAMVCAILAVNARHRLTRKEARIQLEAEAYIRPAGDLPIVDWERE